MKRRIIIKLAISFLVFIFLTFFTLDFFTLPKLEESSKKAEAERLYKEAVALADNYGYRFYNNSITKESLEDYLNIYAQYLDADIWVVANNGDVDCLIKLSESPTPRHIKDFDITEMFGDSYYQFGSLDSYFTENYISVYAPISVKYNVKGYLMIHEPAKFVNAYARNEYVIAQNTIFIVIGLSLIILSVIVVFFLLPLRNVEKTAKEYSNGNFKPKVELKPNNVFYYLGNVMSFMAEKLDTHEDEQRKFISNVSHDFRSPLTSIRGYLQAILDGTIPPELQNKYINIVYNETERLTQLTNNLLDLNRIGSREAHLDLTDFDINQVITSCAESGEVQAKAKNVELSLILCGEQMMVHADRSKIQQVIYNLLDNAMKFSKPDTTITIETTCKNEKLFVSVKDQGIGIPKDSLDNVFNRFYKSDLSRGKDKKGTGLGLAIVKEIIQAHDEVINVVSTVDVGTKFTFSLTLADSEITD